MGKKIAMLLMVLLSALGVAAEVTVTGTVIDKVENEPIIGATIKLKGKATVGTSTDVDGNFTIKVPSEKSVLEITYVGMKPVEVKASTKHLDIVMESSSTVLNEVVAVGMAMTTSIPSSTRP